VNDVEEVEMGRGVTDIKGLEAYIEFGFFAADADEGDVEDPSFLESTSTSISASLPDLEPEPDPSEEELEG
jgi:hypothetical protein